MSGNLQVSGSRSTTLMARSLTSSSTGDVPCAVAVAHAHAQSLPYASVGICVCEPDEAQSDNHHV